MRKDNNDFYYFLKPNRENERAPIFVGQERFTWMTRVYYRDSRGCIIMFDLSNRKSFLSVPKWKRDLDAKCSLVDGSSVPCLLLANKVRKASQRPVSRFRKRNCVCFSFAVRFEGPQGDHRGD